jgi:hypothetical protein
MTQFSLDRLVTALAHIEATYGTLPTFDPLADAVLIVDPRPELIGQNTTFINLNPARVSLSPIAGVVGEQTRPVVLSTNMQGAEALATSKPWRFGPLLRACGLQQTIVAATSITYTPRSSSFESAAIRFYQNNFTNNQARKYDVTGLFGTFTINATAGQDVKFQFNGVGKYEAPTTTTQISPTYETAKSQAAKSILGTYNDGSARIPVIKNYQFTLDATNALRHDANAATGVLGSIYTGRVPKFRWEIEQDTDIPEPQPGDIHTVSCKLVPGAAGNVVTLTMSEAQVQTVARGSQDSGIATFIVDYLLTTTNGDSEFSIAFT